MKQVDRDIASTNRTYFKLNQEKYGLKPPKILANFSKTEQEKSAKEQEEFRRLNNAPQIYKPTEQEWKMIERILFARRERTCPICFGLFGGEAQLITACRHTFHKKCYLQHLACNPQQKGQCIVCRQVVIIIDSEPLLRFNEKLTAIYLQSMLRMHLAQRYRHSLQMIKGGAFSEKVVQMATLSEQVQQRITEQFNQQAYRFYQESEEANRLFDEFLKLQKQSIFEGIQRARKKNNSLCAICYEELNVTYIQWNDSPSAEYYAMSCCGTIFHAACIQAAEQEHTLCVYCKQAYFKIPVSLK